MSGSYRQCVECGKRALSVATRCPGCGRAFPNPAVPDCGPTRDLGRFLSPKVMAGVLATAAVLMTGTLGESSQPAAARSSFAAADSIAVSSNVGHTAAATARPDTASAAASPVESAGELLVARSWTHVRKSRSKRANLEAVLTPGDTVFADSLERGWYRVALEGELLGYAHRSTLTASRRLVKKGRPGT